MARDRANINTNIWTDQDWRDLPKPAQHLYLMLLSHPTLSYAGVADWRPARLAVMSGDETAAGIIRDAKTLQDAKFIYVDAETEEVLIRSFLRHDGLLKQPKLSISMVNAFGAVASKAIREIIIFELQRLADEHPVWAAFGQDQVRNLTKGKGKSIDEFTLPLTPTFTPSSGQAQALPTTTSTTTTTEASLLDPDAKKRPTAIPKDWAPTASHIERAKEKRVNVLNQAEAFKLHAETHDRRAANWNAAFTTWLMKSKPEETAGFDPKNWMNQL